MFKNKLIHKILGIIGITLCLGFAAMGSMALWLEYNATMDLQVKNSRNIAAIISNDIAEYMMKGDSKAVEKFIKEAKEKRFAINLKIYDAEGKEPATASAAVNPDVLKSINSGKPLEIKLKENGLHTLNSAVPLVNEERCKQCHDAAPKFLGAILLTTSLEDGYKSAINLTILLTAAGVFFFLVMLCAMYFFFKKTIVKDLLDFSEKLKLIARGEGDLTKEIPVRSKDEIGQLAVEINHLISKLREIISSLYQQAGNISVSVCTVALGANKTVSATTDQKEQAMSVAVATEEMAATLNVVASNTHRAAEFSAQVDSAASEGMTVVDEACNCIKIVNDNVATTLGTVERLETSSNKIGEIVVLIEDIADQTNLLALNAAIEAARAGEHGRGFAVVADEVKNLSAKTATSTKEIAKIITDIQNESREAASSIIEEKKRVEEGVEKSLAARDCLEKILQIAGESADMINQIASATEEQSATVNEISSKIHHVSETSTTVHTQMQTSGKAFEELSEVAEQIFSTVGKFSVGNHHDTMKNYACELRDRAVAAIEKAVSEKRIRIEDLFDRNYQAIPKTSPQKYSTSFDKFFDQFISPLQEEIAAKSGEIFFAICVDDHGYVPCHNLRYTKPLTGDLETDKVNNRTKRIFDDRTGIRAAKSSDTSLLQTYMRDTGEIMNDMSTPIYINNRHWGAIRIGYKAK